MIHVVDAANRHLYARQLAEMRTLGQRTLDAGSAWLMALGRHEELVGHVWLRQAGQGLWEVSAVWIDGACCDAHTALHRLIAGAAERVLQAGGRRLELAIEALAYPQLAGGLLDLRISGPPLVADNGVGLILTCDLGPGALEALLDSLGEPAPLTYAVDDEDLAIHGSLSRLQYEVDLARRVDACQVKIEQGAPAIATARIQACFTRCDALPERQR